MSVRRQLIEHCQTSGESPCASLVSAVSATLLIGMARRKVTEQENGQVGHLLTEFPNNFPNSLSRKPHSLPLAKTDPDCGQFV
jgi:hypothetical protein